MSNEQKEYLKKLKINNIIIRTIQILLISLFIITWEYLSYKKIINPFIFSSPSKIIKTISNLIIDKSIFLHIKATLYETIIAFTLGITLGFIISILLYEYKMLAKIIDPFLTMLNSLPKVALGPIIIVFTGANINAIILMALLINLIISIITIYNGFLNIDETKIKLLKSFGANKYQILKYLVIPGSKRIIISSLKLNISMTLIGVIMGEFLVSKQGIGYLIIYGTQVFNLTLVMSGIIILLIISFIIYEFISYIEKLLLTKNSH